MLSTSCYSVDMEDVQQARDALAAARESQMASRRPKLARWQPPVCGIAVAAGFCVVGLVPYTDWWRLAALAIMVLSWGGAGLLVLGTRARRGIKGVRGETRKVVATLVAAAFVVFFSALNRSPDMRWIYIGLGIVVGPYLWVVLRRQVRR